MSTNPNTRPFPGTFLTSRRVFNYGPSTFYQNTDSCLCVLNPNGKAEVVEPQKPIITLSPLAYVDYGISNPIWPPPTDVLGKDHQSDIIHVNTMYPARIIVKKTAPETKFAATDDGDSGYVHFQREPELNQILEKRLGLVEEPPRVHIVAENAAGGQPIALTSAKDGPRSKDSIDSAKAKRPDAAAFLLPTGPTRYTVYHGDDRYLWLSVTWDLAPWGPISHQSKVTTVNPDDIYQTPRPLGLSPLTLTTAPGRIVLHYRNAEGKLCRVSLYEDGCWGNPVELDTPALHQATNLSGTHQPVNTFLHTTINVSYQNEEAEVKIFDDTFIWNERK